MADKFIIKRNPVWSKEEVESFNIRMERIIDILDWAEEKGRISYSDFEECALMLSCFIHQFVPAQDSSQTEPVSDDLEEEATRLAKKYFPDEANIWARANIEAQKCKSACIEIVEWLKA